MSDRSWAWVCDHIIAIYLIAGAIGGVLAVGLFYYEERQHHESSMAGQTTQYRCNFPEPIKLQAGEMFTIAVGTEQLNVKLPFNATAYGVWTMAPVPGLSCSAQAGE